MTSSCKEIWNSSYKWFTSVKNTARPYLLNGSNFNRRQLGHTDWNPLFPTPPHPDYPSGHSTAAGAVEQVLISNLDKHYDFSNHIYDYFGMPAQNYSSFEDMAKQIGRSRVLAGIHYTLSCEEGRLQGLRIARNADKKLKFHW